MRSHIIRVPSESGELSAGLLDFVENCKNAADLTRRWAMMCDYVADQGLSHPCYMYMNPAAPSDRSTILAEMPSWWADYYLETHAVARDPFFKICAGFNPRLTGANFLSENSEMLSAGEVRFIQEASETGLISGFAQAVQTIGRGHFGGWHFGSNLNKREFKMLEQENGRHWQLASFLFHQLLQEAAESNQPRTPAHSEIRLSPRERECLTWLANGLLAGQIADHLCLAKVTVDLHLASAKRKLGAATREQAIAIAIKHGQISI